MAEAAVVSYVFGSTATVERDRLMLLARLLDPPHRRALTFAGIGAGDHCLEVGAGIGTMSAWMADRVGAHGSVVATDANLSFLDRPQRSNLTVRQLDVLTDPLPDHAFDVITARALLHHLPSWRQVVSRLARALKPGGRLVVVEPDATVAIANQSGLHQRFWSAWCEWGRSVGVDYRIGHKIPGGFAAAGLDVEMSTMDVPFYPGRSDWSTLYLATLDAAASRSTAEILPAKAVSDFRAASLDPDLWMCSLGWMVVCGRRTSGA